MEIYLVGGAVRDELLNYPVYDKDWVVVGATPELMIKQGYRPVGSDFPVFIHPTTNEEYALARTERKSGKGYTGFQYHASPDVTLEEDLSRRDLTINAMAKSESGDIIDPYGGLTDLTNKVLRHVSPAFSEDPLRVLRVARFAARYAHLGFTVAPVTIQLMQQIALSDELLHLTKERVWQEMERALGERSPLVFFDILEQANALKQLFAPLAPLTTDPLAKEVAQRIANTDADNLTISSAIRFSAFCYICFRSVADGQSALEQFCRDLRTPNSTRELACQTLVAYPCIVKWDTLTAEDKLGLIKQLDLLRRPERIEPLEQSCQLLSTSKISVTHMLGSLCDRLNSIKPRDLISEGFKGAALGEEIAKRQLALCKDC